MRKPRDLNELADIIRMEIPLPWYMQYVIDEGLAHPNALGNDNVKNGTYHFDLDLRKYPSPGDTSKKQVKIPCLYHPCTSDSPASYFPKDNSFRCHSCGAHANVIDFHIHMVNNEDPSAGGSVFVSALKELMEHLDDVEFDFDAGKAALTPEQMEEMKVEEAIHLAGEFYHLQYLTHENSKRAHYYMEEVRGFKNSLVPVDELVKKYKIGYAPSEYPKPTSILYRYLSEIMEEDGETRKYSDEVIIKAGVCYKREGAEYVDAYSNGIIIPYISKGNKIINLYYRNMNPKAEKRFWHRRLGKGVDEPVNFHVAKSYKEVLLFEGEISTLSVIALGFENVLASCGTSGLKDSHITMMAKHRDNEDGLKMSTIYFCIEPDAPGRKAGFEKGKKLMDAGFDVRIVELPSWYDDKKGKMIGDPNDFLIKYADKEMFQECLDKSVSYEAYSVIYQIEVAKRKSYADMRRAIRDVRKDVERVPMDELPFVALEVAEKLGGINPEVLLKGWGDASGLSVRKEEIPGLQDAIRYNWLVVVDSREVYDALLENGTLKNIVLLDEENAEQFIEQLKRHKHIGNIVLNASVSAEIKSKLMSEMSGYRFKEMVETGLEQLRYAKKAELIASIVPMDVSKAS